MFGSATLEVIISLVFIYLLYSLLATVVAEIIATALALRARNLKEAVDRMLNDEIDSSRFQRFLNFLKLWKNPSNKLINNFYNHPEIKYLGSSGLFRNPSSFKAVSFSKTVIFLLNCSRELDADKIDTLLRTKAATVFGEETAGYVLNIWEDSQRDLVRFKLQLEAWFDRTMEQATEWYKRKIQVILLFLGFLLASLFNVDTIAISKQLSKDKGAREQMVQLASAYLESHPERPRTVGASLDSAAAREYKEQMDSLMAIKQELQRDIIATQSILGVGSWLPDSLEIKTNPKTGQRTFGASIDATLLPKYKEEMVNNQLFAFFSFRNKCSYFFSLLGKHWPGFLLTALAISLGAPFWFDLLNKLMKLRTSVKQPQSSTNTNSDNTVLPSDSSRRTE
ncbi:hypothetical protein [Pedobacter sp. SYSU D00535]|uniref:hypothetical protein n=1 Tax=Pedobacter sp. SYSU D00535 TaxID=2810308 RepID=UPI001A97BB72|nr:hypothetical protein [Pedobacter sp. SYSU D00535]